MDEMTQQNASLVEETSAASQSLKDEGKELLKLMSFFNNDDNVTTFEPTRSHASSNTPKASNKAGARKKVSKIHSVKVANSNLNVSEDGDEWEEF